MDGHEMHSAFQSAMGSLAAKKLAARSRPARRYRQGASDGRRREIDNASDSAARSRPRPKRTVPLTISLTKRASRFFECWKVFSAKMFSVTAFAGTSPRINIRTRPPRICGTRFRKRRGKPVGEIAAGWTEQPGFPVVKVKREAGGKVSLTQERFTVNFKNAPPLEWKIPLTYSVVGEAPASSADDRQDRQACKTFQPIARSN